jgi:hypothetical protein
MGQAQDFLLSASEKFKLLGKVRFRQQIALSGERPPHLGERIECRPLQMIAGRSAGKPAECSVFQRYEVKVGAYHGSLTAIIRQRQRRSWSYISANEIPTAEMIVAMTNVMSSLSRVMFHRMIPPHSLVTIALPTTMTIYCSVSD